MNCLADYAARTVAMVVAVGVTALPIFNHAADRTQRGASVATATTTVAESHGSRPSTNAQAAPAAIALAAHDQR